MAIYLGLGSNQGDRRDNLRSALARMLTKGIEIDRVSPVVETPAMLPEGAPPDWNAPFLNIVAECRSTLPPERLLAALKQVERELGRTPSPRWSPRPIDIDILLYDNVVSSSPTLTIPHPGLARRSFFLTPLVALRPDLPVPVTPNGDRAPALRILRSLAQPVPLWMGILNLTPDSFSDGGQNENWQSLQHRIETMIASGVHLLDFGAESTRPGASPLTAGEEWSRLAPVLDRVFDLLRGDMLRPTVSIDTYHPEVARHAIAAGADVINDVSGLAQPAMIELAATTGATFVAMHNLGLPADRKVTLPTDRSAADQVERWLDDALGTWQKSGIPLSRVVFDPGIGFGKTSLQSIELLHEIERFSNKGLRLLIGHSRKSFMRSFSGQSLHERDLVTVGTSIALAARGVDILRVHNVADHVDAWRGFSHMQGQIGIAARTTTGVAGCV